MLQRFFIFCSGADTDLLQDCSAGENTKYAGVGATVFFTAVMAAIAGSYALYTVFDTMFTAIFFGMIWGLLIFNLDRFIVSTIKKRDRFFNELLQASPRIILALIIAIVISKPLEMKIFEKEINQVLLTEKNDMTLANKEQLALQFTPNIDVKTSEISTLKKEITTKETTVNGLYDLYISEAEGTSGTNKLGKGPVYEEKRQKHDAALADLKILKEANKNKIATMEAEIAQVKTDYKTQVASTQPIINGFDGLMARIAALDKLPWIPSFFIFLLFLAIETSPIIAKLLSPKGEYDYKLAEQEGTVKSWVEQQKAQRDILKTTAIEVNNRVYGDIAEEQAIYDYKRKIARQLMQEQADAFYKKQKSML